MNENAIQKVDQDAQSVQYTREREQFKARMGMAKTFWRSGLYPECDNEAQAFVKIQTGIELGLQPAAAMRQIYVIPQSGGGFTISLSADLMKGLVKRDSDVKFEYEKGDGYCELTATRNDTGETFHTRWDRDRAQPISQGRSGTKRNWSAHEAEMLRHRCDAEACRALCPDIVGGLYCQEEAEEVQFIARQIPQAEDAAEAVDGMMGETKDPEPDESPEDVQDAEYTETQADLPMDDVSDDEIPA